uniref:Uncharacterized protein n=1 Tax=Arundo donax TaxID=35708 RepID=A0A0A9AVA0_ARUDO
MVLWRTNEARII